MQKVNDLINNVDVTALSQSFMSACSDKEFKDFVYGLEIKEDILMKYTSSLEDAHLECKNCKKCPGLSECKNKVPGYVYTPIKDNNIINFSYVACDKKIKEIKDNEYRQNIELFDMPKDIANATLKDMYKDDKARLPIIKYFKEFIDNYENEEKPKGLYLHGSFGSGKTYLIAALFNEMAKKNIRSALIYYPEFLRSLKSSFQTN